MIADSSFFYSLLHCEQTGYMHIEGVVNAAYEISKYNQ